MRGAEENAPLSKGAENPTVPERPPLLYGPYAAPEVQPGDRLWCELRQRELDVYDFSSGPIPWPRARIAGGHTSLILCGDLAAAVRREAARTVESWWGVNAATVRHWRQALGVAALNDGTRHLRAAAIRRFSKGANPDTAPQPRRFAASRQRPRRYESSWRRDWSAEEEVLLGTLSDAVLARRFGCSRGQVWRRRQELDIPPYLPEGQRRPAFPSGHVALDPSRLAALREEALLTRRTVAEGAGVNYGHYCQLEKGDYVSVRLETAARIAGILGCTVEAIALEAAQEDPTEPYCWSWEERALVPHPEGDGRVSVPRPKPKTPPLSAGLLHGPYRPPKVRVGDRLFCALRGRELTVVDWSDGPVPWPRARIGANLSLILYGDLVKAVRVESMAAIAWAWGVSTASVMRWRHALKVPEHNEGTRALNSARRTGRFSS